MNAPIDAGTAPVQVCNGFGGLAVVKKLMILGIVQLAVVLSAPAASAQDARMTAADGRPVIIYQGANESCGRNDGVDAPARAFRDARGQVHLFVPDNHNTQFIGSSLLNVRHTCQNAYQGHQNGNPYAYDDKDWLTSFFTTDGVTVYGLVHNEYDEQIPQFCPRKTQGCWEISLLDVISRDGGITFQRPAGPNGVVAAYPYGYNPNTPSWFGYLNPSNIIRQGAYYYVFFGFRDPVNKHRGVSVMRTQNLFNAGSWRGWDGRDFSAMVRGPKSFGGGPDPAGPPLMPVAEPDDFFNVGSVSYHAKSGTYFAIERVQYYGKTHTTKPEGVYYATSHDLLHWSEPNLIMSDEQANQRLGTSGKIEFYPSLLDPASTDRNFGTIGDHPFLFTVHYAKGTPLYARQVVAWPLKIEAGR